MNGELTAWTTTLHNRYFALRHGESIANKRGMILSDPAVGCREYGLSVAAKAEFPGRAREYSRELGAVARIFSSDFLRARETAEILGDALPCEVEYSELLRERFFGDWEATSNHNYARVWEEDRQDAHQTQWNVESVSSVVERMTAAIRHMESRYSHATLVLVSHGDPLQILETIFRGRSPSRHRDLPSLRLGELRLLS